jgi:hypothetical protein
VDDSPEEQTRPRSIRMTDAEWADALFVGAARVRAYVTRQARKMRKEAK